MLYMLIEFFAMFKCFGKRWHSWKAAYNRKVMQSKVKFYVDLAVYLNA